MALKNPLQNEDLAAGPRWNGAMPRPQSRPYSRIRALPASLPRTRPARPDDEASFRNEFLAPDAEARPEAHPGGLVVPKRPSRVAASRARAAPRPARGRGWRRTGRSGRAP